MYDLARGTLTQLTFNERDRRPVWSPDGKRVAYASVRGNGFKVFLINVDGSGEEQLTAGAGGGVPYSFSPDGRLLAYYGSGPNAGDPNGIWILPLTGDRKPQFFRPGNEPDFSPDGRWIAYSVCDRDPCQLYVAPYPGPGEKQQVSANGEWDSRWSPDGRGLLWGGDGGVIGVSVTRAGSALKLGKPRLLFKTQDGFAGVSPDGKRFLMVQDLPTTPATQINVVLNWTEDLERASSSDRK